MQKTISSELMSTRTLLVNPFLYILCLLSCGGLSLYGQQQSDPALYFIDSLNQIIISQPAGSTAQTAASEALRTGLIEVVKHGSREQKYIAVKFVQELDYKTGTYKVLIPQEADTISSEIALLEKNLEKWQDSIAYIQQSLKKIIEDKKQTRATKEKAVFTLATIHDTQVLDYLFENEEKLQFSKFDSEDSESGEQELYRTGMVAISNEYFYNEKTEIEKWLLFNYLLHNIKQNRFREVVLINSLLTLPEPCKSPELLIEFMYANASLDSKKALESFLPQKNMQKN